VIRNVETSRRRFLHGALGAATLTALGSIPLHGVLQPAHAVPIPPAAGFGGIGFASIPPNVVPLVDGVQVPTDYTVAVLYAWGDPIGVLVGSPLWQKDASNTAAEQALQAGMHHDGMHFFPLPTRGVGGQSSEHGLLCINHEYTHEAILHPDGLDEASGGLPGSVVTLEKVRKSQASHGISVIEIRKINGQWSVVRPSPFARRITANTPMQIAGPAAGHPLMRTAEDPIGTVVKGTVNNCAHGYTPWGTYLTCEENWNGNFGTTAAPFTPTDHERRSGITATGFNFKWHTQDPRWDVRQTPQEPHRFGWVEVVVYMGDDERNEYIYKFVCSGSFNPRNRLANRHLLDQGTLYVAVLHANGTGEWRPLVHGQQGLTPANGFADQGEVVIKCRQAADRVGATMMDRPEWIAVHPTTREVYITLTNNNRRGTAPASSNSPDGSTSAGSARPPVDDANPRVDNRYGYILRWREGGDNPAALTFAWDLFVLCGDALDPDANHQGNVVDSPDGSADYGAPDGLWFDKDGRLWIQTDQAGDGLGDWAHIGSNVMMCANWMTGETRRFLTSPPHCEVTGVTVTPDGTTMFVNIQHPGEDSPASNPTQFSMWPDMDPAGRPRAATLVIQRRDGGVIGGL
jgi:hypothetical protein